ncbi:hypothetical protein HDV00_010635 [Rhizophlyctis rosea]|nr:hypothetical protein HDV00_010635 [Rhizophlyctis rosea]
MVEPVNALPDTVGPMYAPVPWLAPGVYQSIRTYVRAYEDQQEIATPPLNPNATPFVPANSQPNLPVGGGIAYVEIGFDFSRVDDDTSGHEGYLGEVVAMGEAIASVEEDPVWRETLAAFGE